MEQHILRCEGPGPVPIKPQTELIVRPDWLSTRNGQEMNEPRWPD